MIQLLERLTADLSAQQRSTLDAMVLPSARAEAWRYSPLRALEAKVSGWGTETINRDKSSDLNASLLASALALVPADLAIAHGAAGTDSTINPHFLNARSVFAKAAAFTAGGAHLLNAPTLWICAPQMGTKLVQAGQRFTVPANSRALLVLEQQDGGAKDALCKDRKSVV